MTMQPYKKIEIQREVNLWNRWLWQPLLLLLLLSATLWGHFAQNYFLYGIALLLFSMLLVTYLYINFVKRPNEIWCEIRDRELIIAELDNPFSKNIFYEISSLNWLWIQRTHVFNQTYSKHLKCFYGEKSDTLINMNSFWFGRITNDSVQELIFYLVQHNPAMQVDESLNEVEKF